MKIDRIISNLLYQHECVIIPGFGAFIANPIGAELNMATRQGHPPRKVLSFNEALQLSDGLLINHIARTQMLSYDQAKTQVSVAIDGFKSKIAANGFLTLEGIGRLIRNPEGQLEFAEEGQNYQIQAFGLPTLEFYPIVRTENVEEKKALIHQHLNNRTLDIKSSSAKPWIPVAAVAAMILLVASIGLIRWTLGANEGIQSENAAIVQTQTERELPESEKITANEIPTSLELVDDLPEGEETPENTLEKEPIVINDGPSTTKSPESYPVETGPTAKTLIEEEQPQDQSYWVRKKIVVGAFGVEQNATRLSAKIEADGYLTEIKQKGKLFHVRVLIHCDPKEVSTILKEVQDQFNEGAWIL